MTTSDPQPPALPVQAPKPQVHVSIPLPWFIGLVAVLVAMAFVAGWFVPSPFTPLNANSDKVAPPQFSVAGGPVKKDRIPENPVPEVGAEGKASNRSLDPIFNGDEVHETKAGTLRFTRIKITPPLEFIQQMAIEPEPRKWVFHNAPEELRKFLKDAGLSTEQYDALWATHSEEFGDNHLFRPDDKFVRGLNAEVKRKLYTRLGEDDRNIDQVNVYRYLGPSIETWLEPAKLSPAVLNEIKALSYKSGPFWVFADLPLIWPQLPDVDARGRLLKALVSEQTWKVALWVTSASDIDALAEYWGRGGRVNQVRPFLEALSQARDGNGSGTSIGSILPPFVQTHLYTFPPPTQNAVEQGRDCHWTALNFFHNKPTDSFAANSGAIEEEIRAHYTQVYANQTLGDVILFSTREGDNVKIFHSAVFIADDLIFTKNGRRSADPFMFMRLDEMKNYYPQTGKVELMYFRRNDLVE